MKDKIIELEERLKTAMLNSMDYSLIPASEDDYDFCYSLTKQNMYDLFCRHWGGWVDSEFRKGFVPDNVQIILHSGERIGYFGYHLNEDSIYVDNIQIQPQLQGCGIGTKILENFLTKYQYSVIRLTTFQDNPAKRLYEQLGFRVYAEYGTTIEMEKQPDQP